MNTPWLLLVLLALVAAPDRAARAEPFASGPGFSQPMVDTKGVDSTRYNQDNYDCQQYANQVSPVGDAAVGAVGGRAVDRPFIAADAAGRIVSGSAADLPLNQELSRAGNLNARRKTSEHRDVIAEHREIHDLAVC